LRRPLQLIGEAYLLGSAALAFLLMAFSVAGIRWSRTVVIVAAIAILIAAIVIILRQRPFDWPRLGWANLIDLLTLALIAGYVRVTTLAPPAEADFYAMWGAKAKQFFVTGGIDWRFLTDPLNVPSHVDYPMLLPLLYDVQALLLGRWPDERWLGLVHIAASLAALMVIRGYLAGEMPKLARAAATLILMPLVFSPFFGLPEGLLAVYGALALLFLRRAIRDGNGAVALRGAVYLGLAASCKNEGLSLAIAVVLAVLLTRPRFVVRLWPALAVALPWLLLRSHYGLRNDLVQEGMLGRLLNRVAHPGPMLRALYEVPHGSTLFWIGVVLACAIGVRRLMREERFLALAILAQLLFFIGAYLVTPNEVVWHVRTSWERLVRQLLPSIALLALLVTVIRFRVGDTNATDS
jgi:hypothetical protein